MPTPNTLLSVPQAARTLGVSRQRVADWCLSGRISATRYGHYWYIRPEDLRRPPAKQMGRPKKAR